MKTTTYTVHASQAQAERWLRVSHFLGFRSVSSWLEDIAEQQARRLDELAQPK